MFYYSCTFFPRFYELSNRRRNGDKSVSDESLLNASQYPDLPGYSELPVIVIFPSMSHSVNISSFSSVHNGVEQNKPGWWEDFVGSGTSYAIDTDHYRVIVADNLGGPFGTTGPLSPKNPLKPLDSAGQPTLFLADFPLITPIDQALCHARLLEYLGIIQRETDSSLDPSSPNFSPPKCESEKPFTLLDYVKRNVPSESTLESLLGCQSETSAFVPETSLKTQSSPL